MRRLETLVLTCSMFNWYFEAIAFGGKHVIHRIAWPIGLAREGSTEREGGG